MAIRKRGIKPPVIVIVTARGLVGNLRDAQTEMEKKRRAIKVVSLSSVSLPVNRQTRPILGQNPTVRLVKILNKAATCITTIVGHIGLEIDLAE